MFIRHSKPVTSYFRAHMGSSRIEDYCSVLGPLEARRWNIQNLLAEGPWKNCVLWNCNMFILFLVAQIVGYQIISPRVARQPLVDQGLLITRIHDHTQTHHTRWDSSVRGVISLTQRPLLENTQSRYKTSSMHTPGFEPAIPANERPKTVRPLWEIIK
jgi:hypothetical protein